MAKTGQTIICLVQKELVFIYFLTGRSFESSVQNWQLQAVTKTNISKFVTLLDY